VSDTNTDRIASTAISAEFLGGVVDESPAMATIVILDCCYSGNFKGVLDPDELFDPEEYFDSGAGRFVMTSARQGQLALDAEAGGRLSPFTELLIEALIRAEIDEDGDGVVTVDDVFRFLSIESRVRGLPLPQRSYQGDGSLRLARRTSHTHPVIPGPTVAPTSTREARSGARSDPLIGSIVASHRLEEFLGASEIGMLYRGRHVSLNRRRLLRIFTSAHGHSQIAARFRAERDIMTELDHPNIVRVVDAGDDREWLYLVMDDTGGRDLIHVVTETGGLDVRRAAQILEQVAHAVESAHRADIVHGQLQPGCVFVTDSDFAYVSNFTGTSRIWIAQGMSRTSIMVGTPGFVAPEQLAGSECADNRVDIYALGCLLYYSLTATRPFEAESAYRTLAAQEAGPPPEARAIRRDLPDGVDAVIATAMASEPGNRYESCAAFVSAMRSACV
jgi:serine/threonine-protein kinase